MEAISLIKDVTNARKLLLSIQDEVIEKFGTEKNVIDDVTMAINEAVTDMKISLIRKKLNY